jgi:hypothetical protein
MIFNVTKICPIFEAINVNNYLYTVISLKHSIKEVSMFPQSKILVWYQVASQKVVLGEAFSSESCDVASDWLHAPSDGSYQAVQGYRLSLFDDDGREIADKPVSMFTADAFLEGIKKASV